MRSDSGGSAAWGARTKARAGGCSAVAAAQGGRAALEITGEAADATEAQVHAKWLGFFFFPPTFLPFFFFFCFKNWGDAH